MGKVELSPAEKAMVARIVELRRSLGLSQKQFSASIAVSSGYIGQIEMAFTKVTQRLVKLICFTYNVSKDWLVDGIGEMYDKTSEDTNLAKMRVLFETLSAEKQEMIFKIMEIIK